MTENKSYTTLPYYLALLATINNRKLKKRKFSFRFQYLKFDKTHKFWTGICIIIFIIVGAFFLIEYVLVQKVLVQNFTLYTYLSVFCQITCQILNSK